jgi:hypothetical protein
MLKSQARADDYRAKALNETELAQASGLVLVREKHELAASVWRDLAATEDRRSVIAYRRDASASLKAVERVQAVPKETS